MYLEIFKVHVSWKQHCFHLMITTVIQNNLKKLQSNTRSYTSNKNFSNGGFMETLINKLSDENLTNNESGFQRLCDISLETLNKHAPCKKKHARGNQMTFFNKQLSKVIMTRTKLRNIFLQNRRVENRMYCTKQRNFCASLLRKTKKRYYENLSEKSAVVLEQCKTFPI